MLKTLPPRISSESPPFHPPSTSREKVVGPEGALLINPHDASSVAEAINLALTLSAGDREALNAAAMHGVRAKTAGHWSRKVLRDSTRERRSN